MEHKFRINADNGEPFFGGQEEIRKLPDEYQRQVTAQIEQHAAGKAVDPVKIPYHILEKSGFLKNDEAREAITGKVSAEPLRQSLARAIPHNNIEEYDIRIDNLEAGFDKLQRTIENKQQVGNCETCPFKEAAMKLIAKTLEKI